MLFRSELSHEQNAGGAQLRPQTTARGVGVLYGLETRTPWDKDPKWRALRDLTKEQRLAVLRDPQGANFGLHQPKM